MSELLAGLLTGIIFWIAYRPHDFGKEVAKAVRAYREEINKK